MRKTTRAGKAIAIGCWMLIAQLMLNPRCDAQAQADSEAVRPADSQTTVPDYDNTIGLSLLKNLAEDQKAIWTSPAHLRLEDADWLLPLGAATGGLFATDTEFEKHLSNSPSRLKYSKDFSNYGLASFVALGGGMYVWGHVTHDEHKRETGLLAGEAALDSLAVTYATKYSFGRERPLQDNYRGAFWQGGDSFPSEHSSAAWAIAGVIAHEYPGPLTDVLAYGLASAVSASRLTAKQHFPSDVLIGSAIGWFVGEEVYRRHHDPDLGGASWETYKEWFDDEPSRLLGSKGSPYVELDSWIYPAIEQLAAMGYIHSEFLGLRPWTRIECAQLLEEAQDEINQGASVPVIASQLFDALEHEFSGELGASEGTSEPSVRLESLYAGMTDISGPPLHDSYHFGQTIVDNYGRPYEEGFNSYDGFSGYGTAGRFTIYIRGEYQHSPFAPGYPLSVREAIATADINPLQPATPFSTVDRFTLLDTYIAANVSGWNLSFGKQSLWWGPGDGTSLLLSDNAEPMYMFRASPNNSFEIPFLSRVLGPAKMGFFFGKLSGNEFPPRPLLHGEDITFKPTSNLEFSFSRIVEFGGVGRPLTLGAIWNSYVSTKSSYNYRASANPGKRTSSFSFSYRPPLVRDHAVLYAETIAADDVVPLESPPRAAWNSGLYVPTLPLLSRLALRVEGGYTDAVTPRSNQGLFVYWEDFYHDLSTNKGNLIGSWIGREGKAIQATATYSFSSRTNVEFRYREGKVAKDFIPGGETLNDGSVTMNLWVWGTANLSTGVQYEKWLAPILAAGPQTNWTSSVQFTFYPHWSR